METTYRSSLYRFAVSAIALVVVVAWGATSEARKFCAIGSALSKLRKQRPIIAKPPVEIREFGNRPKNAAGTHETNLSQLSPKQQKRFETLSTLLPGLKLEHDATAKAKKQRTKTQTLPPLQAHVSETPLCFVVDVLFKGALNNSNRGVLSVPHPLTGNRVQVSNDVPRVRRYVLPKKTVTDTATLNILSQSELKGVPISLLPMIALDASSQAKLAHIENRAFPAPSGGVAKAHANLPGQTVTKNGSLDRVTVDATSVVTGSTLVGYNLSVVTQRGAHVKGKETHLLRILKEADLAKVLLRADLKMSAVPGLKTGQQRDGKLTSEAKQRLAHLKQMLPQLALVDGASFKYEGFRDSGSAAGNTASLNVHVAEADNHWRIAFDSTTNDVQGVEMLYKE